jgi:membrane-associated phospholipid phosphatase
VSTEQRLPISRIQMAGVVVSLAVFVPLAYQVHEERVPGWDARIHEFLTSHEEPVPFNRGADRLVNRSLEGGADAAALLLLLTLAAVLAARRRFRETLFLAGSLVGVVGLTEMFKEFLDRAPAGAYGWYSFPSGHAARSTALAAAVTAIAWRTPWRWPVAVVSSLLAAALGVSVVYEDWHLPSDVLGGWALALAWAAALHAVLFRASRHGQRPPDARA